MHGYYDIDVKWFIIISTHAHMQECPNTLKNIFHGTYKKCTTLMYTYIGACHGVPDGQYVLLMRYIGTDAWVSGWADLINLWYKKIKRARECVNIRLHNNMYTDECMCHLCLLPIIIIVTIFRCQECDSYLY